MNRKKLSAIILCFVLMASMMLSACSSGPKTLEEYINSNEESLKEINDTADAAGLSVSFSENDVIYSYDLATVEDVNEEVMKSDIMKKSLEEALDNSGETFVDLCKELEEESTIEGVRIIINYNYGDETIVSRTFTSAGAEQADAAAEEEGSEQ